MKSSGTIESVLAHKGWAVYQTTPQATVYEAISCMDTKNVGALLVMEGERLVGMISERDYTRKVAIKGKVSKQVLVEEIMTKAIISVTPRHTIDEGLRLMNDHRVRHLPVLEGEKVVGIVSIGNLVNWIISSQKTTITHLEDYISGKYPG